MQHYRLHLAFDPDYDQLDGTAAITAKATQNLSRFDLDLSTALAERISGRDLTDSFNTWIYSPGKPSLPSS